MRIDLASPGRDASIEVDGIVYALMRQKVYHLHTANAVMADYHGRIVMAKLIQPIRYLAHGNELAAGDMANLEFPGLAHVNQMRLMILEVSRQL